MENERKATPRQLAYIQHLRKRQGKESLEIEGEMGFEEASRIISDLMGKPLKKTQSVRINEARLGMAFKYSYRRWTGTGHNIFRRKEDFIQNVLDTYGLYQ